MLIFWSLMWELASYSHTADFISSYLCTSNSPHQFELKIDEHYKVNGSLLFIDALLTEDGVNSKPFSELTVSTENIPGNETMRIVRWKASEFELIGYLSKMDASRNFMAHFNRKKAPTIQLSCEIL